MEKSDNVTRIYPESKTGLIKWIEDHFQDHFHEIKEFVITLHMDDETTMTVYDVNSYFNAIALCGIQTDTIMRLQAEDQFVTREHD